jgi:16S rRNA (guanine527-N7)-methyltransferase
VKPNALQAAFPDSAQKLEQFEKWLVTAGVERGILGPREVDRIWDRHIANCAVIEELIPENSTVLDIGSGAGLPGVVLAIVRPDLKVGLIEPLQRRCDFLSEVIADLGLADQVKVYRGRAQEFPDLTADIVTGRAVAPLFKFLTWTTGLLRPDSQILAMKGSSAAAEIEAATSQLVGKTAEIIQVGKGIVDPLTTVVRIKRA